MNLSFNNSSFYPRKYSRNEKMMFNPLSNPPLPSPTDSMPKEISTSQQQVSMDPSGFFGHFQATRMVEESGLHWVTFGVVDLSAGQYLEIPVDIVRQILEINNFQLRNERFPSNGQAFGFAPAKQLMGRRELEACINLFAIDPHTGQNIQTFVPMLRFECQLLDGGPVEYERQMMERNRCSSDGRIFSPQKLMNGSFTSGRDMQNNNNGMIVGYGNGIGSSITREKEEGARDCLQPENVKQPVVLEKNLWYWLKDYVFDLAIRP